MVGFVSKKGGKIQMTPGVPDGPDPPNGAGTGTGVRDDQAEAGSPL